MKRALWAFFFVFLGAPITTGNFIEKNLSSPHYLAQDIKLNSKDDDLAYFPRPVSISFDQKNIYVVDAKEDEIRVFSKSGAFLKSIGRRGQAPGEFESPQDIDIFDEKIYISESSNSRIQILDINGKYLGGFKVLFAPDQVSVLEKDRILVSELPLLPSPGEKMIHCFSSRGKLLWENVEAYFSGDSVYDTFRNFIILNKGDREDFFLIRKSNDRFISHFNKEGKATEKIEVAKDLSFKKIVLPLVPKKKELFGFCWDCCFYKSQFYWVAPEYTAEKDLGPGKQLAVISLAGTIEAFIDLPDPVKKISVENDLIYALDGENYLRIFQILKK
jgi:hypothetical protein